MFIVGALMSPIPQKVLEPEFLEVLMESLPTSAQGFVDLIGLKATLDLIQAFGGTEMIFPKSDKSTYFKVVSDVVGETAALKLGNEYHIDKWIYIPLCVKTQRALRNRQIIIEFDELLSEGASLRHTVNLLARKYRTNYRQIENIVNG